jgi:hypothetical protein
MLERACNAARAGKPDCTILFFETSNPDGITSDVTTIFANSPVYGMYINIVNEIAHIFNCGVYNEHALVGQHGVALGYQTTTDGHGTNALHAHRAAKLAAILGL